MKYVAAIDQSTSATKVILLDENLRTVKSARKAHRQYYPAPGYVEHDAEEIWNNTAELLLEVCADIELCDIAGVGIANQRETTLIWDRETGRPVHRAIVWQDVRAKPITDALAQYSAEISALTGLLPSPYYSAAKAAAVLQSDAALMDKAKAGKLCFGTVDSYLLYRLTGGKSFSTDVSNASRTQLMELENLKWSPRLAELFGIPLSMLPDKVLHSDADFGAISTIERLRGLHVTAMLGDSHASFYGHGCTKAGMVKTSYGTGSSIMMNIGDKPLHSANGLSTSVGYACGGELCYVLEGNVTSSADTLLWLKDELQLISGMDELELAAKVSDTGGVYLVPAFSGLGAPWFYENAKAVLYGMNRGSTKAHVLRAALASIAHQNADVLDAIERDTGIAVEKLYADGGGSVNRLLMQMQSDLVPCRVIVSAEKELTLHGAALMAGQSRSVFAADSAGRIAGTYAPSMDEGQRLAERQGWFDAIGRCS